MPERSADIRELSFSLRHCKEKNKGKRLTVGLTHEAIAARLVTRLGARLSVTSRGCVRPKERMCGLWCEPPCKPRPPASSVTLTKFKKPV